MMTAFAYQMVKIRQKKCVLLGALGQSILGKGREQRRGIKKEMTEHFASIMTTMTILIALVELTLECEGEEV